MTQVNQNQTFRLCMRQGLTRQWQETVVVRYTLSEIFENRCGMFMSPPLVKHPTSDIFL
jgi:hypothetical protein